HQSKHRDSSGSAAPASPSSARRPVQCADAQIDPGAPGNRRRVASRQPSKLRLIVYLSFPIQPWVESNFRLPQCKRQLRPKFILLSISSYARLILDFAGRSDTHSDVKTRLLQIAIITSILVWRAAAGPAPVLSVSGKNTVLFQWPTNFPSFALE